MGVLSDKTSSRAAVIVVSDRICAGDRQDKASPVAVELLERAGFQVAPVAVINEGFDDVSRALAAAVSEGSNLVVTCGGTGVGARNLTPEATLGVITTRLEGLENQILFEGLKSSQQAGLSRGVVGLTSRESNGVLIVNAPSSPGGVRDALTVIASVWPNIQERLGQ
ncbi:MogA/MoaB family molybdenum cofactor biosynthesis protein [Corynebacterium lubricantis]|uniref:MogA/MoaB family molybdenum cofactor biosynthesis protein n=1 Tax=Corynebacterium lubricantis TaxID=541095 RepID=UPI00036E0C45|nr:MogA/MoaB family molybdenum cofactor biosynthesis protein [Corynebacterium lubricantis]